MYASTCVIVVMIFSDNTVIVQHRAAPNLYKFGNKDEAYGIISQYGSSYY